MERFGADAVERGNHAAEDKVKAFMDRRTFERQNVRILFDNANGLGGADVFVGEGVAARARVDLFGGLHQAIGKAFDIAFLAREHVVGEAACRLQANSREGGEFRNQVF